MEMSSWVDTIEVRAVPVQLELKAGASTSWRTPVEVVVKVGYHRDRRRGAGAQNLQSLCNVNCDSGAFVTNGVLEPAMDK